MIVVALGLWLVLNSVETAPRLPEYMEDFDNSLRSQLAKRLLKEEKLLRNRLTKLESVKRGSRVCGPNEILDGMTCKPKK